MPSNGTITQQSTMEVFNAYTNATCQPIPPVGSTDPCQAFKTCGTCTSTNSPANWNCGVSHSKLRARYVMHRQFACHVLLIPSCLCSFLFSSGVLRLTTVPVSASVAIRINTTTRTRRVLPIRRHRPCRVRAGERAASAVRWPRSMHVMTDPAHAVTVCLQVVHLNAAIAH